MKIKVLGSGCVNCMRLEENTLAAVKELGLTVELEHIYDMAEIVSYGIMATPALVVDEKVILAGKVADSAEIKDILNNL